MHVHDSVKVLSRVGIACGFGVREFVRDTQLFWICLIAVTASCPKVLPKFFFPPPEGRLRMPGVGLGLIESAIAQAMASFLFRSTRPAELISGEEENQDPIDRPKCCLEALLGTLLVTLLSSDVSPAFWQFCQDPQKIQFFDDFSLRLSTLSEFED
jgi:hypothetical protein